MIGATEIQSSPSYDAAERATWLTDAVYSPWVRVQICDLHTIRPTAHPVTFMRLGPAKRSSTLDVLLRSGTNNRALQRPSLRGTISLSSSAPINESVPLLRASAAAFSEAHCTRPQKESPQGAIEMITLPLGLRQCPSSPVAAGSADCAKIKAITRKWRCTLWPVAAKFLRDAVRPLPRRK
jgi:hypothetical protein